MQMSQFPADFIFSHLIVVLHWTHPELKRYFQGGVQPLRSVPLVTQSYKAIYYTIGKSSPDKIQLVCYCHHLNPCGSLQIPKEKTSTSHLYPFSSQVTGTPRWQPPATSADIFGLLFTHLHRALQGLSPHSTSQSICGSRFHCFSSSQLINR